jgi:predicted glycosyltransferase
MDVLGAGCRAVVVPFAGPGGSETEQPLRARLIAARRPLQVVAEAGLDGARLAAAVDRALDGPAPGAWPARLDGAARAAATVADFAARAAAGRFSSGAQSL